MARYNVASGTGPLAGVQLLDTESGAMARVLPDVGANCAEFRIIDPTGQAVDVLFAPTDLDSLRAAPARHGWPLLFPFPSRIQNGRYAFEGQTYQLRTNHGGHAIHGLVINQPFRIEAAEGDDHAAHVRCVIAHADFAQAEGYPFPFRFVADYTLAGGILTLTASATNTGDGNMPMGFGIHPYFRLPLAQTGARERCQIAVPVRKQWVLDQELITTGELVPLPLGEPPIAPHPLGDRHYDDVYGGVQALGNWSTCRLLDPDGPIEIDLSADRQFREYVVYAPPKLPALCFEPYTCTTNAFNLQERGIDAGRIVLAPGQIWSGTMRLAVKFS